mgnify:CR=1 FL=1
MNIECPNCKKKFSNDQFLYHCREYDPQLGVCKFYCPNCSASIDTMVTVGNISLGYVYSTGNSHFSGVIDYQIRDLKVDGTMVSYNGLEYDLESGDA